ncbi:MULTISPECIES: hypothetical protein [Limosilactobacillus]|uniref:Uncharacterized protein n=1 Tax=Limosilactobacillus reuteri TaxID=1598 RepID=A0AAX2SSF2_LIMRT|nr:MULTISPECIES: hypothetical protein [Limosilactobacillus]MBB1110748.1 hypothetical protein [Limosilactobacillus balticus]RMX26260.1 hypothetical protein C6H63_08485 [Limosilactobacillus reuteri]TGB10650.1 hypothetical protein E5F87_07355 [Limosilactobacillus reuteri]
MYLYNFDNIQCLLRSDLSDKKLVKESGINIKLIQELRQLAKDREKLQTKLTWNLVEKLNNVLLNSYTSAEYDRFIKYCRNLYQDSKKNDFIIRVSRSMEKDHAWNYCSIAKNNLKKGAFDHKEFKIPVVVALYFLDTEYIPHFFNPID